MKNKSIIYLLIIGILLILTNSCQKDRNVLQDPPTYVDKRFNPIIFNSKLTYGTMKDIDSNVYKTINIGTQTWMAENLKVTHYRNNDSIPNVTNNSGWFYLSTGVYCNFENNLNYVPIYGRLYNYYSVVDARKLCPTGWHIPTDTEWTKLISYLGGESVAGGKLKEIGSIHWDYSDTTATNETGFTALTGHFRMYNGGFELYQNILGGWTFGEWGAWWSSSVNVLYNWNVIYLQIDSSSPGAYITDDDKRFGCSVRCVMD